MSKFFGNRSYFDFMATMGEWVVKNFWLVMYLTLLTTILLAAIFVQFNLK